MVWKDAGAIFQRRFHWRRRCQIVRSLSTRDWHIKDVYMRQKKKDIYVLCEVTRLPRTYTYVLRQMKSPKVWSFELPWTNKLRSLRKVAGSGVYLALLRRFLWCANFEQLPFLSGQDRWYNNHLSHFSNSLTGASVAVQKVSLYNLISELEDLSKASFYSYKGSLTTPPCYESVRWIVLKTPIDASKKDVRTFFTWISIYFLCHLFVDLCPIYFFVHFICLKINFTINYRVIRY